MMKMQQKYKRIKEINERRKLKNEKQKEFMKQIEDTAIIASQVQSLTQQLNSSHTSTAS